MTAEKSGVGAERGSVEDTADKATKEKIRRGRIKARQDALAFERWAKQGFTSDWRADVEEEDV